MKSIVLFLFVLAFSFNAAAQEKYPELASVKDLSSLNSNKSEFQIDKSLSIKNSNETSLPVIKNLSKINSRSALTLKSIEKKKAYTPKVFNFSINPYVWFMAVGGTVGYYEDQKFAFNKSFSDAVKYLKMAAAVAGKFKYKRVSFVYDISYVNLKGFGTEVPAENAPHILSSNWTVKQTLYDLFLTYLFPSKSKSAMVDIYVGTRIWALNTEATIMRADTIQPADGYTIVDTTQSQKGYNNTWVDPVIGVNSEFVLSKDRKWIAYAKGDIGGFGVNSQMTWQMTAGAGYMLSPNFPLTLGFKYVGVNYDKEAKNWTVNDYGPILSIGYRY